MFEPIIRFYENNKKAIIRTILICATVILVVQLLNLWAKNANDRSNSSMKVQTYVETESIINNKKVNTAIATENKSIIKKFVDYCNNGDIEQAYNLISDDCKNVNFKTIEEFRSNYFDIVFKKSKTYTLDMWYTLGTSVTYKVDFKDNLLQTGGANVENYTDYITVVRGENNNIHLNILGFISIKEENKLYEDDKIKVEIKSKVENVQDVTYTIVCENKTDEIINLYDKKNEVNCYLLDEVENKYYADISGILQINENEEKTMQLQFNKTYNPDKTTRSINFTNVRISGDLYTIKIDF